MAQPPLLNQGGDSHSPTLFYFGQPCSNGRRSHIVVYFKRRASMLANLGTLGMFWVMAYLD